MRVIAVVAATGEQFIYDEPTGRLILGDESMAFSKLLEYDSLGALSWPSEEMRAWAYQMAQLPSPPSVPTSPEPTSAPVEQALVAGKKSPNRAFIIVGIVVVVLVVLLGVRSIYAGMQKSAASQQRLDFYATAAKTANESQIFQSTVPNIVSAGVFGQPYASIYESANYPGQAVVTVVFPTGNTGFQFVFDPNSPTETLGLQEIKPGQVDSSLTDWNAKVDSSGRITVNGREDASLP